MKNPASAGFFFAWVLSGLKGCSCKDRHSARDCVQSQNLLLPNHLSNHQHCRAAQAKPVRILDHSPHVTPVRSLLQQ